MTKNITNVAYCPHCGNEAPQRLVHKQSYYERSWNAKTGERSEDAPWSSFVAACETCGNVLVYDNVGDQTDDRRFASCDLVYPKNPFLPFVVPRKIASAYAEAYRVKNISPNAFAVLIRRTLEILCNERGLPDGTLAKRLKILSDRGEIPPTLSQSTDLLRLIGNIGAHGSERSVHALQVRAVDDFFVAILEYLSPVPLPAAFTRATPHLRSNPVEPENACLCVLSLPHLRTMPGQPLRRARRAATRDAKGEVAPPRRLRAGLSPVTWRRLSPVEKLQSLYGLSLDAALEDLSYRGDDPHRLAARTSARHDVMMICAKYAIEMSREGERQRILSEMSRREFGDDA